VTGTWREANTTSPTILSADRALLSSNRAHLPPLVYIDQARSYDTCQAQSVTLDGTPTAKRLLRRKEQIAASAWSSAISDANINTYEAGNATISTSHYCNSNTNGLTYEDLDIPTDVNTLPGNSASSIRSVITGGTMSTLCKSRYGAQDLVGNVWEWLSDQLATCDSGTNECVGGTSTLDTSNTDWNAFRFDGIAGPGGTNGGAWTSVDSFQYQSNTFNSTRMIMPLGLPVVASSSSGYDSLLIGTDIAAAKFHGDYLWLYTDNSNGTPARGGLFGGNWSSGTYYGRWSLHLLGAPTLAGLNLGFRCVAPAGF